MKDTRCEYVTSHDAEARRRRLRLWLLDDCSDRVQIALAAPGFHNAVLACFSAGHELNTEQRAAFTLVAIDHLLHYGRLGVDQIVREHYRKRLVTDHGLRAQHRMTESQRLLLPHVNAFD